MNQNMLVERLKYAKRELTALKTTHQRGLGLLKVYTVSYIIQPPDTSAVVLTLKLIINFSGIAYPLAGFFPYSDDPTDLWGGALFATTPSFLYTNNGYTIEFEEAIVAASGVLYKIFVYSTSPISSISYTWS